MPSRSPRNLLRPALKWWQLHVSGGWLLALGVGFVAIAGTALAFAPKWTLLVIGVYVYLVLELAFWGAIAAGSDPSANGE